VCAEVLVTERETGGPRRTVSDRAVIDALPRAVIVFDLEGRVLRWSGGAERLLGWAESEVVGRTVIELLVPPGDQRDARKAFEASRAGRTVRDERTLLHRSGRSLRVRTRTVPVNGVDGTPTAVVSTLDDLTELQAAEGRVRRLLDHLRVALDAGGLGTWRWDRATGETVWDQRMEALFGLPPGGFDGRFETWVSLLHPDDREEVLATVERAVDERGSYRVEHRVVWPDGSVHWIAGAGDVTLEADGEVSGTVGCSSDMTERRTQEADRQRLAVLAVQSAERERVHRERLEFLSTINEVLNASSTVAEVMRGVTRRSVPRLGDWCSIHVLPRPGAVPDVEVAHVDPSLVAHAKELQRRFASDPSIHVGVPRVLRTGETVFRAELTDEALAALPVPAEVRQLLRDLRLRSAIIVPLVKRGRILGAMQFGISGDDRRYTDDDVALALTLAGRIASSLENLRLQEQQRVIARTLQRSLLPDALPELPGVEVAVRYWAAGEASEVGGDFYDVFSLGEGRPWAVVIGDVCGTGPEAAALTSLARHTIRDSAWHGDGPQEVFASLDRAVRRSAADSFLTAVYAVLEASGPDVSLEVTCAGHPHPLLVRGSAVAPLGSLGSLLGIVPAPGFHPVRTTLVSGDVVVLFTDGATDVAPPHGLDDEAFRAVVAGAARGATSAEEVADRIRDALAAVQSFDEREDDIALLVLRVI
jgi:PAS domain S-box-containing protein